MKYKIFSKNLRINDDFYYNYALDDLTKFQSLNQYSTANFNKITLNFGFKTIKFEKKKMVLFFLALELITTQKCILTFSTKNIITWKIKRGSIVGCKLTLRNENLLEFLDNLNLMLPRSENFQGFFFNASTFKTTTFSTKIQNLFIFYPLEQELTPFLNGLDINFNFNNNIVLEKFFLLSYYKITLITKNNSY